MPRRKKLNGFAQLLLDTPYAEWPEFAKDAAREVMLTVPGSRIRKQISAGNKDEAKRQLVELILLPRPSVEDL